MECKTQDIMQTAKIFGCYLMVSCGSNYIYWSCFSLSLAYTYINNACNLISTHQ